MARTKAQKDSKKKDDIANEVLRNGYRCSCCGRVYTAKQVKVFYKSNSELYKSNFENRISTCKDCVIKIYNDFVTKVNEVELATKLTAQKLDFFWDKIAFDGALRQSKEKGQIVIQTYITKMNSLKQYKGKTFSDYLLEKPNNKSVKDEILENQNKTIEENEVVEMVEEENNVEDVVSTFDNDESSVISDNDIKVQQDIIRLLGYDPFREYGDKDRKYMYGELLPYLNEDTLEDGIKLSAYIQIVNNNNQVRKLDLSINSLNSEIKTMIEKAKEIETLTKIKSSVVSANDKIMKENSISVKNRADKKAGKNTLGGMMKTYREYGFDDAHPNYFDMKTCDAMLKCAKISNKAIWEQLNLDEKDFDDMILEQRVLIQELQEKELEMKEKIRKLARENIELKQKISEN